MFTFSVIYRPQGTLPSYICGWDGVCIYSVTYTRCAHTRADKQWNCSQESKQRANPYVMCTAYVFRSGIVYNMFKLTECGRLVEYKESVHPFENSCVRQPRTHNIKPTTTSWITCQVFLYCESSIYLLENITYIHNVQFLYMLSVYFRRIFIQII